MKIEIPGVFSVGLTCLLAYLKINGHIDISWLWVFVGVWGPLALVWAIWIAFLLFTAIVVVVAALAS